jgi:hypothetical protein
MIRRGFPNIVILIGIVVFALSVIGGYLWISTKQLEKTVLETPNTGRQQIIEPPPKPEIEEPKETPFERVEREEVLEELEKPKKIIPSPTEKLPEESEKPQEELALPETRPEIPETMAFEVKVPSNTPEEDLIFLRYWHPTPPVGVSEVTNAIQMERVAPFTYRVEVKLEDFKGRDAGYTGIEYRYVRADWWDMSTAEVLTAEEADFWVHDVSNWGDRYRQVAFDPGKIQKDVIKRWRWFPRDGIPVENTSDIVAEGTFLQRVNGIEFRSGQGIQDLYLPSYDNYFDSLAQRLKEKNYTWAAVYPPWDWIREDPLPLVGNPIDYGREDPSYPDEKLILQIRALKKAGLKILLAPQICCTSIGTQNRSEEWKAVYLDEVEKFLVHFALIAQQTGSDAFLFEPYIIPSDRSEEERIDKMLRSVKEVYSGEVGTKVSPFILDFTDEPTYKVAGIIPGIADLSWGNSVDFILYPSEGRISSLDNPTKEQLVEGVGILLDVVKPVYDAFGKPVIVQTSEPSIKGSWKYKPFLLGGFIPGEGEEETGWELHEYSGEDQARIVDAYFEAIRQRPWIIGLIQFGYEHWDLPLLGNWSVRAKPAEDVWVKWNNLIYKNKGK